MLVNPGLETLAEHFKTTIAGPSAQPNEATRLLPPRCAMNVPLDSPANPTSAKKDETLFPTKEGQAQHQPIVKAHASRRERRHPPEVIDLSQPGYLRLEQVLKIYPVSRASWYAGIGTIYPSSVRIGPRSVAWRTEDIRKLIDCPPAFAKFFN